ncbi:MAG: GNAT family N-acetyltransferase [Thermoguttaceae bacterium]|nr:GNAT family N-acetyltransferase [Thermoguttaceae bacterium]
MQIRRAEEKDVERILELLSQVLELHARIRPDIFIPGTTKYTRAELVEIFQDNRRPVYVAVDDADFVVGYAFCVFRSQPFSNNMIPFESLFIDDLCVDEKLRGRHVGRALVEHVQREAEKAGCYETTLNVWEGNDAARGFYEKLGFKPKETQMEFILK